MKKIILSLLLIFLSASFLEADLSSIDSTAALGGSARTLGMGGMFLTVKSDPAAILSNPAGLAEVDKFKFFVMNTKTLQEVNYLACGFVFPLEKIGTFGIGLVNRSIGDIPFTDQLVLVNGNIDYDSIEYGGFSDDVAILSYANKTTLFSKQTNYGINLKLFQKKTTNYKEGNASGINMDAGVQFALNRDLDLGFKMQNLFINSAGGFGSLLWDTGESEAIDSYFIAGVSNKTLYRNLLLGLDVKKTLTRSDYPLLLMLGGEWHPHDALFFRCGMDQNIKAPDEDNSGGKIEVINNFKLGVGVNLYGWRFDYAYMPNMEIKDLTTHIFSISLVGDEPAEKPQPEESESEELVTASPTMFLTAPEDRSITTSVVIKAEGQVLKGDRYILNGEEYQLPSDGRFTKELILALGINDVTLTIPGAKQKLIRKVLRLADFKDIDESPYKNQIVNIATLGYIKGDYPDRFNPRRFVTRAEMAAFVIKINRFTLPLSMKGVWSDADILASQGILRGFPDGFLKADEKLTKAQVAMVLSRIQNLTTDDSNENKILANEHWSEGAVSALSATGIYSPDDFSPRNDNVTKEQLVDLFSRLPTVQKSVEKMLNFDETGQDQTFTQEINAVFMRRPEKEQKLPEENILNEFNRLPEDEQSGFDYQNMIFKEEVKPALVTKTQGNNGVGGGLPAITIIAPPDKSVVYKNKIVVQGNIVNVKTAYLNGETLVLKNGAFAKELTLKNGKNSIIIKAFNASGKYSRTERKVLKLPALSDIKEDDPYKKQLAGLVALGIVSADQTGKFDPAQKLLKKDYANLLSKAYGLPAATIAAKYMSEEKEGYQPLAPLTRAYAVVVLTRIEKMRIPATAGHTYQDVTNKNWAYCHIAVAKENGLLTAATYFRPEERLDKKTAAIFISNTPKVKSKLSDILSWSAGY